MTTTVPTPNIPGLAPEHWLCDQCSEYARCEQGVCICKDGWNGNGFECSYNCPDESFWNVDRCQPISGEDIESKPDLFYSLKNTFFLFRSLVKQLFC